MTLLRTAGCRVSGLLPEQADRIGMLVAHRSTCLRCQAELARRRRLERQLRGLADITLAAPDGLLTRVMSGLERHPADAEGDQRHPPWAWVVPAAAAAGCAMALAIARRALAAA